MNIISGLLTYYALSEMNRTSSGGEETEEKANDHPGSQSENTTSSKKSAKKDAPEEALVEPKEADIEEQKQPDQNDEPAISEPVSEKGDIAPEATPEKTEIEHTGEEFITQVTINVVYIFEIILPY